VALGINGTGKTTFSRKFVDIALNAGRRALIVTAHENEWTEIPEIKDMKPIEIMTATERIEIVKQISTFTGQARILIRKVNEIELLKFFHNGIIIFDDCRNYVASRLDDIIVDFLVSSRQQMVDIIANAHGFGQMPPAFFTYITHIALFKVNDSPTIRKKELYLWRDLVEVQRKVNEEFNKGNTHTKVIMKV